MKFVTAHSNTEVFVGLVNETDKTLLALKKAEEICYGSTSIPDTMLECIEQGDDFIVRVNELNERALTHPQKNEFLFTLDEVELLAPIPRPKKNIFCVGKNYRAHAIEMGSQKDIPEHIIVFTKAPTTVIGTNAEVYHHKDVTEQLDYEGELAVIIGKKGRAINAEDALEYIFGYTIINDVTARDLQERHKQYFIGKSLDTTCPMGPWIVHSAAIENPNNLNIETRVNGEVRQKSNTDKFIFSIEKIIATLSQGMTLEPGDIIATGTPAGVGKGMQPQQFLKSGDKTEITIEKIGTLVNWIAD